MSNRIGSRRGSYMAKLSAGVVAVGLCSAARMARAADGQTPGDTSLSPRDTDPQALQPGAATVGAATRTAASRTPMMSLFDQFGLARPLDDARINIYGHIEGSYTYNFVNPTKNPSRYSPLPGRGFTIPNRVDNPGRVFDVEDQDPTLNQLSLNVERLVNVQGKDFDIGGRMEWMYGGDARFIHGNGLFDNHADDPGRDVTGGPDNEFDLVQLYADINVPIGNGLRIRAGKFEYFKQIDPNYSVFYSHSYTFGAALPFTLTGVYGTYRFSDQLTADLGISRGWDQALEDDNGAVDFFGRVKYTFNSQTSATAAFITGPELPGDNAHWRTVVDVTLTHQVNDKLTLLLDGIYGQQSDAPFVSIDNFGAVATTAHDARWYGVSAYAIQKLTDQFSVAGRLEWYRDDGGFTTAVNQSLYEATIGMTITPFPADKYLQFFVVRPELRYDYSTERFFDGFNKHYQVTAAVDAVFNF